MLRKMIGRQIGATPSARFCPNCGKELGRVERLVTSDRNRCRDCDRTARDLLKAWRTQFLESCNDGLLRPEEWDSLRRQLQTHSIALDEGTEFIRRDAVNFVERTLAFAKADEKLDSSEETSIRWLIRELRIEEAAPYLLSEIEYLSRLRRISDGDIPTIRPNAVLQSEELCYFEGIATYHRTGRSGSTLIPGRLIVTSRRVIFAAASGGGEIPLSKIINVTRHSSGIFLELSRKANTGFYAVQDPRLTGVVILPAVRLATRQIIGPRDRDTRHIPQHIKIAVWQRDQGRCAQCGATEYLEFDHIIPHSKGGATSVNNLQLLCRRCNLQKGENL